MSDGQTRRPAGHQVPSATSETPDGGGIRPARAPGTDAEVAVMAFEPAHLEGILEICVELGWPSLPADAGRAARALSAPGVTTVVAVAGGQPVGFAQILGDGAIQCYLAQLAVRAGWRRRGIGRRLVAAGFAAAGGERVDLLATPTAEEFYRALPHKRLPGYRLYPHLAASPPAPGGQRATGPAPDPAGGAGTDGPAQLD